MATLPVEEDESLDPQEQLPPYRILDLETLSIRSPAPTYRSGTPSYHTIDQAPSLVSNTAVVNVPLNGIAEHADDESSHTANAGTPQERITASTTQQRENGDAPTQAHAPADDRQDCEPALFKRVIRWMKMLPRRIRAKVKRRNSTPDGAAG